MRRTVYPHRGQRATRCRVSMVDRICSGSRGRSGFPQQRTGGDHAVRPMRPAGPVVASSSARHCMQRNPRMRPMRSPRLVSGAPLDLGRGHKNTNALVPASMTGNQGVHRPARNRAMRPLDPRHCLPDAPAFSAGNVSITVVTLRCQATFLGVECSLGPGSGLLALQFPIEPIRLSYRLRNLPKGPLLSGGASLKPPECLCL